MLRVHVFLIAPLSSPLHGAASYRPASEQSSHPGMSPPREPCGGSLGSAARSRCLCGCASSVRYLISVFTTVSFVGAESMRQRYGEDYQYMGWPNGQGNIPLLSGANGGYCMLASSQHKDAAWQLLKTLL